MRSDFGFGSSAVAVAESLKPHLHHLRPTERPDKKACFTSAGNHEIRENVIIIVATIKRNQSWFVVVGTGGAGMVARGGCKAYLLSNEPRFGFLV